MRHITFFHLLLINYPLYFTAGITSANCIWLSDKSWHADTYRFFLLPNPVLIYILPPAAVSEDAIRLNETLRTPDKTLEKSLPELQSEAERMVTELRSRNLHFQERIAQNELKWVERVFSLLVIISDSCNCHPFQPGVQAGSLQWRKTV